MRAVIRKGLDSVVDRPFLLYLIAAACTIFVALFVPTGTRRTFVTTSLPAIPGVAFSLFGFAVTAVSIMVTLKGLPYFDLLQREKFPVWKALIGTFIHEASVFAFFGIFALLIPVRVVDKLEGRPWDFLSAFYFFVFFLVVLATASAVYMLRLVANTPPIEEVRRRPIDTSPLDNFQNPTEQLPPRRL